MKLRLTRRRMVLGVILTVVGGWLITLVVLIAAEPEPGAASAAELRETLSDALNTRDEGKLAALLDLPVSQRGDFAKSYVAKLAAKNTRELSVTLSPGQDVVQVRGRRGDGAEFTFPLSVKHNGEQWFVEFAPPIP